MKDILLALALVVTVSVLWIAVPLAAALVGPALAVLVVYYIFKELRHEARTETNTSSNSRSSS